MMGGMHHIEQAIGPDMQNIHRHLPQRFGARAAPWQSLTVVEDIALPAAAEDRVMAGTDDVARGIGAEDRAVGSLGEGPIGVGPVA
jgi:hypothetical protein